MLPNHLNRNPNPPPPCVSVLVNNTSIDLDGAGFLNLPLMVHMNNAAATDVAYWETVAAGQYAIYGFVLFTPNLVEKVRPLVRRGRAPPDLDSPEWNLQSHLADQNVRAHYDCPATVAKAYVYAQSPQCFLRLLDYEGYLKVFWPSSLTISKTPDDKLKSELESKLKGLSTPAIIKNWLESHFDGEFYDLDTLQRVMIEVFSGLRTDIVNRFDSLIRQQKNLKPIHGDQEYRFCAFDGYEESDGFWRQPMEKRYRMNTVPILGEDITLHWVHSPFTLCYYKFNNLESRLLANYDVSAHVKKLMKFFWDFNVDFSLYKTDGGLDKSPEWDAAMNKYARVLNLALNIAGRCTTTDQLKSQGLMDMIKTAEEAFADLLRFVHPSFFGASMRESKEREKNVLYQRLTNRSKSDFMGYTGPREAIPMWLVTDLLDLVQLKIPVEDAPKQPKDADKAHQIIRRSS